MIFYMQMRWNIEGRLKLDEVWDLEIQEAKAAKDGFKLIAMYKVAGQRRVIAIVEIASAEELDRVILGRLDKADSELPAPTQMTVTNKLTGTAQSHSGATVMDPHGATAEPAAGSRQNAPPMQSRFH